MNIDSYLEAMIDRGLYGSAYKSIAKAKNKSEDVPPRPIHWDSLSAKQADTEWFALNEWVEDIRRAFVIPAQVIPPFWHRHRVLVEHLSALRTHYFLAFDASSDASAPFDWIKDLDDWQDRARELVARLGTRIDCDRAYPLQRWPGAPANHPDDEPPPVYLADRFEDFLGYVSWDLQRRKLAKQRKIAAAALLEKAK